MSGEAGYIRVNIHANGMAWTPPERTWSAAATKPALLKACWTRYY
jgi:hypothetical protein